MFDKSVVLFGCTLCERLKPVGVVRHSQVHCPALHALGHLVGDGDVEGSALVNDFAHLVVGIGREILVHLLLIENVLSEKLRRALRACRYFHGALLERLVNNFKP